MEKIAGYIAIRLRLNNKAKVTGTIIGALAAALVAAGVVLAAVIVSNMLTLGPAQLVAGQVVQLTMVKDLPSSIVMEEVNQVQFEIQVSREVSDATLWVQLRGEGTNLDDPTIVEIEYSHPGESSESVSLTPSGANLRGALKSGWNISVGYIADLEITLMSNAPITSYFVDLWLDGTVVYDSGSTSTEGQGQQSQGQSFTLNADKDGFVGVSGASGINPTLTVVAGELNEIAIEWQNSMHNLAIYTQPCGEGFCDANLIAGGRSANVTSSSPTAGTTFSFPTAGQTPYYICDYHPDDMNGTVNVVQ